MTDTKPISDEAVKAAVEALAAATLADFYALPQHDQDRLTREMRAAIAAADAIREKEGRAVGGLGDHGAMEMPWSQEVDFLRRLATHPSLNKVQAAMLRHCANRVERTATYAPLDSDLADRLSKAAGSWFRDGTRFGEDVEVVREAIAALRAQAAQCPHIVSRPHIDGIASVNYCRLNGPPDHALPEPPQ